MQVISFDPNNARPCVSGGCSVAIGVFDAMHLGHRRIIQDTLKTAFQFQASPVAITFERHPAVVLNPDKAPGMIYPLWYRLKILEDWGIQKVLIISFTKEIAQLTPVAFYQAISKILSPLKTITVGHNFTFARNRSGNVQSLKALGETTQTTIHEIPPITLDGQRISSTQIRGLIQSGNLLVVSRLLGRPYRIVSQIVKGDQIGRTIGVPTANLDIFQRSIPPNGVYAARAELNGVIYSGCLNIGLRPTLGNPKPQQRAELHILDFDRDIYGRQINVEIVEKLRDEKKFASLEELRRQIDIDIQKTRIFLK